MTNDTLDLKWDQPEPVKMKTPERTWEKPDYLPACFDEARTFEPDFMDRQAISASDSFVFDIEVFENYFLAAFQHVETGKVLCFESGMGLRTLRQIMAECLVVSFNGTKYDLPLLSMFCAGRDCKSIKAASDAIVRENATPWEIYRRTGINRGNQLTPNHIDLMRVCPLLGSLKAYAGRLHVKRLQELPFLPDTILTERQIMVVRWYCLTGDLPATAAVYKFLRPQIEIRESMSSVYGIDLRSKSDAQIAESVINLELAKANGGNAPHRQTFDRKLRFQYSPPRCVRFAAKPLREALETIREAVFTVAANGAPVMPEAIRNLRVEIGQTTYQLGIGGLHSQEVQQSVRAGDQTLIDFDVTSYYPSLILTNGFYPRHLGEAFLTIYRRLVDERITAKRNGDRRKADMLKIVINGTFGKLGSMWSTLYAPEMMVQVTITGQLYLLMLIDGLEAVGIPVLSANTDGILFRHEKSKEADRDAIIHDWEVATAMNLESTAYHAMHSRDVNNYIGIMGAGKLKCKGAYSEFGFSLNKNPQAQVCNDAVFQFLIRRTPIVETILNCDDIRRFLTLRTVRGGACKDGEFLGKVVRWYHSISERGKFIVYAANGNRVPLSAGARPCMDLPDSFPVDIDIRWYVERAHRILKEIGC